MVLKKVIVLCLLGIRHALWRSVDHRGCFWFFHDWLRIFIYEKQYASLPEIFRPTVVANIGGCNGTGQ
jgi:hypothetical protein